MIISAMNPDDCDCLADIANKAFSDEIELGLPSFTRDYFLKRLQMDGVRLRVAYMDESAVGFLLLTDGGGLSPAQIHLVAVDEGFRGKGVGKMLVGDALDYVRGIGGVKMKLFTRPWNISMSNVCKRLGFKSEAYLQKEYLGKDLVLYAYFI